MTSYNNLVTLIRPDFFKADQLSFPMASLALGSYLSSNNIKTAVFDFVFERIVNRLSFSQSCSKILACESKIYGITVYHGQLLQSLKIAKAIKNTHPRSLIVLGGPGVAGFEDAILTRFNTLIDFICIGEGECVLHELSLELLNHQTDLSQISGIAYYSKAQTKVLINDKRSLIEKMDSLPHINYSLIDINTYLQNMALPHMNIIVGQGCPFNCSFCSTSTYWGRKYRTKSPLRILDEMNMLHEKYKISSFNFIHDNLLFNKKFTEALCSLLVQSEKSFVWYSAARIDSLDKGLLSALSRAGCKEIFCGIESGSERIQTIIGKKLSLDQIEDKAIFAKEVGIRLHMSFILDLPDETQQDRDETLKLISKMSSRCSVVIHISILEYLPLTKISKNKHSAIRFFNAKDLATIHFMLTNLPHSLLAISRLPRLSISKLIKYISTVSLNGLTVENIGIILEDYLIQNDLVNEIAPLKELISCDQVILRVKNAPDLTRHEGINLFAKIPINFELFRIRSPILYDKGEFTICQEATASSLIDKYFVALRIKGNVYFELLDPVVFTRLKELKYKMPFFLVLKDFVKVLVHPSRSELKLFRLKQKALILFCQNGLLGGRKCLKNC